MDNPSLQTYGKLTEFFMPLLKGVDVRNSEQDDHMIKRKLPGDEDKYPQDKISEQGTDGMLVLTYQVSSI